MGYHNLSYGRQWLEPWLDLRNHNDKAGTQDPNMATIDQQHAGWIKIAFRHKQVILDRIHVHEKEKLF